MSKNKACSWQKNHKQILCINVYWINCMNNINLWLSHKNVWLDLHTFRGCVWDAWLETGCGAYTCVQLSQKPFKEMGSHFYENQNEGKEVYANVKLGKLPWLVMTGTEEQNTPHTESNRVWSKYSKPELRGETFQQWALTRGQTAPHVAISTVWFQVKSSKRLLTTVNVSPKQCRHRSTSRLIIKLKNHSIIKIPIPRNKHKLRPKAQKRLEIKVQHRSKWKRFNLIKW